MRPGRLITLIAIAVCAGCSEQANPPPSPAPLTGPALAPRPREIRVDDVNPCEILSAPQLTTLGVSRPRFTPATATRGNTCQWSHSPDEPLDAYAVEIDTKSGIESSFDNPRGVRATLIAGFPTIETQGFHSPSNTSCGLVIDIARGQTVNVSYDYNGKQAPMNRDQACLKARGAAELAMQTLLQRSPG